MVAQSGRGRPNEDFCAAEVEAIIDMHLDRVNSAAATPWRDYFEKPDRLGYCRRPDGSPALVSRHRYDQFVKNLDFDPQDLMNVLNKELLSGLHLLAGAPGTAAEVALQSSPCQREELSRPVHAQPPSYGRCHPRRDAASCSVAGS